MVGIVPTAEAMRMAREAQLDLVEVAPTARPPVCKILDYGKWRYQQQKKEDKSRASARAGQLKELKLRTPRIGDHDLEIKITHAKAFLEEGNKVQFTLQFRGRELAHVDLGYKLFRKVKEELFLFSKVERDHKMEGKRMTMVLQPDHKAPGTPRPMFIGAAGPGSFSRPPSSGQTLDLRTRQPVGPSNINAPRAVPGHAPIGPAPTPPAPPPKTMAPPVQEPARS